MQKSLIFLALDVAVVPVALLLALLLHGTTALTPATLWAISPLVLSLMLIAAFLFRQLGLSKYKLNSYETRGVMTTAMVAILLGAFGAAINSVIGTPVAYSVFIIFSALAAIMGVAWRLALRRFLLSVYRRGKRHVRVLVYGAGQTGQQLAAALRTDDAVEPIAFIDDNPKLQSMMISGLPVYAKSQIKELVTSKQIDRVVLAMPSLSQPEQARIAMSLRELDCEVHALPSFAELVGRGGIGARVKPVSLDTLLGRNKLENELPGVSHAYSGRRILVTGAGGSIGSELCRQLISCQPACVVLLDHSELALYQIDKDLRDLRDDLHVVPVLGSVCDAALVADVLADNQVDVVLHAAAYKHVPMVEMNPLGGLDNNVFGTRVVAEASRDAGVERFILVSSDKAVRPTNVMGASKRLAELVVQDLATRSSGTRFSMVRFGNVLGSSGSVIPRFEEQIARGGPVTLTHGSVTRYFMTISEAARLVLLAGSFARGGDVFVLDMGEPVPIRKLARQMIEGAGYSVKDANHPDGDIEIKITGLRPGEKLHEELLISPDMLTTPHTKILRAQESYLSEIEMANALRELRKALDTRDVPAARAVIARWVEQFNEANRAAEEA
ncbi:polysaccharide biosynthesis protein [Pseudaestuariivita atlantica]|uniref:Nucleotide sugar epimerase n=1 Tax=Pseudaestuariivita atlantica TaxID=1317121 RepID=A0A0L1JP42_9RHOB|nr:nucleoside-diphosphate sugar epimerase/dehydratase [Pseudaestuariivita atlantica]KNG93477.1 nucleotide sugar epimerase [Pseudaestuariivita atlantica]